MLRILGGIRHDSRGEKVRNRLTHSLLGEEVRDISEILTYNILTRNKGYHTCPGRRFARLNIKLASALFLLSYDYSLEDKAGQSLTAAPEVNRFSYE